MTYDEYLKWQKANKTKVYAESTQARWRSQARKAIKQAVEQANAEQRDLKKGGCYSLPLGKFDLATGIAHHSHKHEIMGLRRLTLP